MNTKVTGLMVCYRTPKLVENAYSSYRRIYPDVRLVIVNNSESGDPCTYYIKSLKSELNIIIHTGSNIGHGPGMHVGLKYIRTKYALIFDSDVVFKNDVITPMLDKINDNSFGVGKIVHVDLNGDNVTPRYTNEKAAQYYRLYGGVKTSIPYLHPFCHLLNIANYRKYKPYIDHGAPCIETMIDIHKKGRSKSVLLPFNEIEKYVNHKWKGTRSIVETESWNSHYQKKERNRKIFMTSRAKQWLR